VAEPKDLAGTKIRVQPGAIYTATYRTLGAAPQAIDVAEIYLSLSQHAVDALEVPLISLVASKFYEVAKHITLTNFNYNPGAIMASKRTMDKLEPQFQKAIRDAALAVTPSWRTMMATKTDEAVAFLKTQGCTITDADKPAYTEALKPVYEQFRPIVGAELLDSILKQTGSA
jgi:TRAP-type C4-dicarboxylate transport system substrate-binding protein